MPEATGAGPFEIDAERVSEAIQSFLREQARLLERDGAVVGLSSGVDSSVTAALSAAAFGPDRVLGLILPERESDPESKRQALALAEQLGIPHEVVDITRLLKKLGAYRWPLLHLLPYRIRARRAREIVEERARRSDEPPFLRSLRGLKDPVLRRDAACIRLKPRIRMVLLYHRSELNNYLVVGTTNRTEYMTGFFTKHGDAATDVEPLLPLYKTQVRLLARHLGIPDAIISKPPSPDVVAGVTDEMRLRVPYPTLDLILDGCERAMPDEEIAGRAGVEQKTVDYVRRVVRDAACRRDPPAGPSAHDAGLD